MLLPYKASGYFFPLYGVITDIPRLLTGLYGNASEPRSLYSMTSLNTMLTLLFYFYVIHQLEARPIVVRWRKPTSIVPGRGQIWKLRQQVLESAVD